MSERTYAPGWRLKVIKKHLAAAVILSTYQNHHMQTTHVHRHEIFICDKKPTRWRNSLPNDGVKVYFVIWSVLIEGYDMEWAILGKVQILVWPAMCMCVPKVYLCFLFLHSEQNKTHYSPWHKRRRMPTHNLSFKHPLSCTTMEILHCMVDDAICMFTIVFRINLFLQVWHYTKLSVICVVVRATGQDLSWELI